MIVQTFGSGVQTLSKSSHVRVVVLSSLKTHLTNFLSQDDFFVGIGDINSAFLPKVELLAPAVPSPSLGESFFR